MSSDKIVISGISGVYPKCNNIAELAEKLFAKEDLITDIQDMNFSAGKLNSVSKFDSTFFGTTNEHAEYMDPMCRILLEKTFEAILDAGYNPEELRDTNTAVYIANCTSDAEVESAFGTDVKGALICERAQSFLANRISYCFSLYGPSCTVNTACSSSLYALEFACKAIKNDKCVAAIVGGSNLSLAPGMIQLYKNLGITSARCKSFDDAANGFCRSEAISVIFIQKIEHARRMYAEVVHVKTNNDGYKKQSILFPSHRRQMMLINAVYNECGVPKSELAWIEAHGTGTRVGDYQEMKSLETLCEDRDSPLLVGCVKSCLGHTEATSGLCSIAKVIIAMETGCIPPNLHFSKPQNGIEALLNGEMKIITEGTPWNGGYVAVNNFGIGGANAHLLLKSNTKEKESEQVTRSLPKLVAISGRTSAAVDSFISYLRSNSINRELIALLHGIFSIEIPHHDYRGYIILDDLKTAGISQTQRLKSAKRPIWFIYPGMGSQWPGMGKQLFQFEIFEKSIRKSHKILEQYDINLLNVLQDEGTPALENILHCFVGITAIMIALTDLIRSIGIECDGMIGHSFGEIVCAYADNCLTHEQALLAAYYRGVVSLEHRTENAEMIVVGLNGFTMQQKCTKTLEVVCYNGSNSCTIAGSKVDILLLVQTLKSEGIFVAHVYSANIAYHSSYIKELGPKYYEYLKMVIPNPQTRSSRWISSSEIPSEGLTSSKGNLCSPEYFQKNFTNSVQFEAALKSVPNNAVTIEVAPHSILKSVLNGTLNGTIVNVSLVNKNSPDIVRNLLKSLGSLYNEGVTMDLRKIYPPVSFPVSRGTPMISPLIKWNHEKDWHVPFQDFDPVTPLSSNGRKIDVNHDKEEYRYLQDHIIDGKNLFPESGLLKMVWDLVAERRKLRLSEESVSITFRDLRFYQRIEIPIKGSLNFELVVTSKSGSFEIVLGDTTVADGFIEIVKNEHKENDFRLINLDETCFKLKAADIYKELRIKGYKYGKNFQSVMKSNFEGTAAKIEWKNNWVTYLDSLFQLLYYRESDAEKIRAIFSIGWLHIRIPNSTYQHPSEMSVFLDNNAEVISDFIEMADIKLKQYDRYVYPKPILQTVKFTPYFGPANAMTVTEVMEIILTVILENNLNSRINVHELHVDDEGNALSHAINDYFQIRSFYKANIVVHTNKPASDLFPGINFTNESFHFPSQRNIHLMILRESSNHSEILRKSLDSLTESGFILSRERKDEIVSNSIEGIQISAIYYIENEKLILWHKVFKSEHVSCVEVGPTESFDWIKPLQNVLKERDSVSKKVIIHSNDKDSGIVGLYNCIRKEKHGHNIRCFLMLDSNAPPFDPDSKLYADQLKLDLTMNVYKNGLWGCYIPYKLGLVQKIAARKAILSHEIKNEEIEFEWVQEDINEAVGDENDLIYIHYATYPENIFHQFPVKDCEKGRHSNFIFSGKNGKQLNVMGLAFGDRISNVTPENRTLHWTIPENCSMELAALSIYPYLTAMITLTDQALIKGDTIVVQNAFSFFGTVFLTIALFLKYKVFTIEKNKDYAENVKYNFAEVSGSFVINEVPERIALHCNKAPLFVIADDKYHLFQLSNFSGFEKTLYLHDGRKKDLKIIEILLRKGTNVEFVNLLEITSAQAKRIETTFEKFTKWVGFTPFLLEFEKMNITQNIKLQLPKNRISLFEIRTEQTTETTSTIMANPRFVCSQNDSFIICGGLGGMGFELAAWLIERGAKKLVLVSRTGFCDGYRTRKISEWRRSKISVVLSTDNICSSKGVRGLLNVANELGPVAAIFNTTLVLRDGLFENQTPDTFLTVAGSKATATILLDQESRKMCPGLRHFVVFSSIVCGYGNAGQSNYGYANSVMERICETRRECGLPGLAIEWAGVDDVGYMKNPTSRAVGAPGTLLQPIRSCLNVLDQFLTGNMSIVTSFIVDDENNKSNRSIDSVFTTIKKIIDKSDLKIEEETTLEDIGLDSIAVAETKNILEQDFNLFMDAKEVLGLRVNDLWKIESGQHSNHGAKRFSAHKLALLEELYGNLFQIMLKTVDLLNLRPLVRLPSFLHNGATNEIPTTQEKTIFFLPSIEGFASVMQPLASNIDVQVLCAQYDLSKSSIKQIVEELLVEIESRLKENQSFHLLGYSYGGLLAMEIAHELEKKGRIGFIYVIDSSPTIVKSIARSLFGDEDFRTNNLAFVRALNCGVNSREFEDILLRQKSWQDMKNVTMDFIPDFVPQKREHLHLILDTLRTRNEDLENYDGIAKKSLISKVHFFKPKDLLFEIPSSCQDLSEFCCLPVQEFEIVGNHFNMLKSEKLAYHIRTLYKNVQR